MTPATEPRLGIVHRFLRLEIGRHVVWLPLLWIGWPVFRVGDPFSISFLVILVLGHVINDRALDAKRRRLTDGSDARSVVVISVSAAVAIYGCIIDVARLGWLTGIPLWLRLLGFVLIVGGLALRAWSAQINSFFSVTIALQEGRHYVVDRGPYAVVRHPAYAAILLFSIGTPLALGSWLGYVPAAVGCFATLRRTELEDRFLHEALEGYAAYAQRVRAKLIPRVY